jgi:hypothetical protein
LTYLDRAYIQDDEIAFISQFMGDSGTVLEVGAYVGKTFSLLHDWHPEWEYVAVDKWEIDPFPMTDPNIPYDINSNDPLVHSDIFRENCPWAELHVAEYENILFTKNSFDVIILSAAGSVLDFGAHYLKALDEVKDDGIIIGRYLDHSKYGDSVAKAVNAINPENFMDYNGSMFAIW